MDLSPAMFILIRTAVHNPANAFFVLLSESCVPLYPARAFYLQVVHSQKSRIDGAPPLCNITLLVGTLLSKSFHYYLHEHVQAAARTRQSLASMTWPSANRASCARCCGAAHLLQVAGLHPPAAPKQTSRAHAA